ncbi:hypothetical protein BVC80_9097g54 [Macleaya cordata]|uniref:Uncharacterized protein n=1 Tax=Macleaya cordata TaxID=56857 RepID=A0A200QET3_MACCD|nr:hypothetical protein BVC80_9097g54 [Macleaya cordata]
MAAGKVIKATVLAALVVVAMSMSVMITTEASRLDLSSILGYIGGIGIDNEGAPDPSLLSVVAWTSTTSATHLAHIQPKMMMLLLLLLLLPLMAALLPIKC